MFETRVATEADAEVIAEHRWKMFAEMGHGDEESMQAMVRNFVPWVRERLKDGRYLGWLIVEGVGGEDGVGVAGGDEGAEEGVANLASSFL